MEVAPISLSQDQPDVGEFQRSVLISIETGYCTSELPPVFDHVEVTERPKTAQRPFKSAVLTAYVRFPGDGFATFKPCSGLGLKIERRVKTKRPVSQLLFYDGSSEPPEKLGRPPGVDSRP